MKVLDDKGVVVTETLNRNPAEAAAEALAHLGRQDQSSLLTDAANLAPVAIELEAVRLYAETGSLAAVSRRLGIAIYQLQKLQRTDWWQAELAALRREVAAVKTAKLEKLHGMALEQLEDRLCHGDFVAIGSRMVRVKLSGKDLARVSDSIFKQRQLLTGEPTEIRENKQLEKLAAKLRALGMRDPVAAAQIVEGEVRDVTTEERATPDPNPLDQEASSGWRATSMSTDQRDHVSADARGDD